ncbi:MAG: polysaccharide deacetylase family protein [Lachnospiraceae bacterium]|nr:polysaccharide deacetylase family protein [Lachnospiraceae bacterium]
MNKKRNGGWLRRSAYIGARIVKSLFFWGMAAVLASSAYMDFIKLSDSANTSAVMEDAGGGNSEKASEVIENTGGNSEKASAVMEDAGTSDSGGITAGQEDRTQKKVALTFDDGPHSVYTKKLLDGLAERNVHASFFVIGKNIPGNEELIARMQQEGHLIGNHTYDHVKICDLSGAEACEQVEKTSALVREITGKDTEFVRPPFGAWNKSMECSFTMIPVLWDVDPLDWTTKNKALIEQRVLEDVDSGDIILLHDYYESSVEAALELVDKLKAEGYEFVTVDELILE